MVDDVAHLDLVDSVRSSLAVQVRVAVDIDAGLRVGGQHVGPKRSPLYDTAAVVALARAVVDRPGFHLAGVMTYEGQIAGVPDVVPTQQARSLIVRRLKSASVTQLEVRRREIADALAEVDRAGVLERRRLRARWTAPPLDPAVTEIAAGLRAAGARRSSTTTSPSSRARRRSSACRSSAARPTRWSPCTAAGSSPPARPARTGCRSPGRRPGCT